MRERKDLDRRHLPLSTYEAWLSRQKGRRRAKGHRNPTPDIYEEWVEKRVEARVGRTRRPSAS